MFTHSTRQVLIHLFEIFNYRFICHHNFSHQIVWRIWWNHYTNFSFSILHNNYEIQGFPIWDVMRCHLDRYFYFDTMYLHTLWFKWSLWMSLQVVILLKKSYHFFIYNCWSINVCYCLLTLQLSSGYGELFIQQIAWKEKP